MSSNEPMQAYRASRRTVTLAESRVIARRERVKALTGAIRDKSHRQVASAGMVTTAFGVGIVLAQIKRRHAWWLVSLLAPIGIRRRAAGLHQAGPTTS